MWDSCGCWFRVGGGACIRGSVLASTATKVVGLGSGLGSLWGFFVGTIFSLLCLFLGLFLGLFFFRRMVFLLEGVRLWERGLGAVVVALVVGFGG